MRQLLTTAGDPHNTRPSSPGKSGEGDRSSTHLRDLLQRGYRFAYSLTHDPTDAEDLVQDAWLAVLKADGPRTVPYLLAAIRSRFIDVWRRKKGVTLLSLETTEVAEVARGDGLWSEDAELRTDVRSLARALEHLDTDARAALYLSAVEGYSTREIAELLNRPRGTILSMMFRSREKLRKMLAKESEVNP